MSSETRDNGNVLLGRLDARHARQLTDGSTLVPLRQGERLHEPGSSVRKVYLVTSGMVSLIKPMLDGASVEAASVGKEGVVGIEARIGIGTVSSWLATVQLEGEAIAFDAAAFRDALDQMRDFRHAVEAFTQALLDQVAQNAACNITHNINQRMAKWLLHTQDRISGPSFNLTQEFLANMLGVTRPSVSVAAQKLQDRGFISYRRGSITVKTREGLEKVACECYANIRDSYIRLIGFPESQRID